MLTALVLVGWFSAPSSDSDTWWTLKTGQYIVQHHALAAPDPFSYTTYLGNRLYPGEEAMRDFNLKFEWLAEVILYLVWAAVGFPGVILMRAAILAAFAAAPGLVVFHRTRSLYRALAATGITAFSAVVFSSDRAYQFTNLFLAATLVILERRRGLWLLPPVFLIWSNCHGGYILGFAVLGAYLAEALLLRWRGRPPADERKLWLVSTACLLLSGINPNGFRAVKILFAYRQSGMIADLFEWQRPQPWPPTMIGLLLAAALAVLIWMRPKTRVSDWLLLFAFGAAYFSAVRNTPVAGLIASLVILSYLPWKGTLPAAEWVTAGVLTAALIAEAAAGRAFQLHETAWKYPSGAADFILTHHITGRMFNSWQDGGYLLWRLWPAQRVFIDGRTLNESVFRDYQRMIQYSPPVGGPSGRELLDRYGIEVILLNGFEANSGNPYMLPVVLAGPSQKEWSLVYQDAQATIFMRHPPPDVPVLPPQDVMTGIEAQCRTILDNDPERPRCARGLGRLFARTGDFGRARLWLGLYMEHRKDRNPADDELFRRLGGTVDR